MRVLFIGGTGLISSACAVAVEQAGHELWLLNRGRSPLAPAVPVQRTILADANDAAELRAALKGASWDAVVQWIGFHPDHVAADVESFATVGQYVFISSASVYAKPPASWLFSEQTPLSNPYAEYSANKIACEQVLRRAHAQSGFPVTIVRPSHTYGRSQIPVIAGSGGATYTVIDRMRRGAKIIVPGDGTSIWTLTHNTDFAKGLVGLLGQAGAIGEDFQITSDEALSWNQIYGLIGAAAGVEPDLLHVPSDAIIAADPGQLGPLRGDMSYSAVFDNSKLRTLVPDFTATTPFSEGVREAVAWFDADAARQQIDARANTVWDRIAAVYVEALRRASAG